MFDLTLSVEQLGERLEGSLQYSRELFEPDSARRTVGHLRRLLEGIVADPETRLQELPLLTEEERKRLLWGWNGTPTEEFPQTICDLVQAQVRRSPQATALVCEDQELSYQELDRRANRLAHLLGSRGAGP